jgi:hypothetical protein
MNRGLNLRPPWARLDRDFWPEYLFFVKSRNPDSSSLWAKSTSWLLALLGMAAVAVGVMVFVRLRRPSLPAAFAVDATPPAESRPLLTDVPQAIEPPAEGHPMIASG